VTIRLREPDSAELWAAARRLVEAYAASLDVDLDFQNFGDEVQNLARTYGPPDGAFLLAEDDAGLLGCVGLRPFSAGVCEMKRLYVLPAGRGRGVGRALVEGIIAQARRRSYRRMLLDTLPTMSEARTLYASLGFAPIPAYRHNPIVGTAFLALDL
jgi:carbonic anhydrase